MPVQTYRYETHLHTLQGSACAAASGKMMAIACKEAGYSGIMVTDHFYYGNTAVARTLNWEDWVELFAKGYEQAKSTGDEIGLKVFFGWEADYDGTEFLIYGPDKQWLLTHPEIRDASILEQYQMITQANGLIIQAHPFRKAEYIKKIRLFPEYVHGVEGINATHSSPMSQHHVQPEANTKAIEYANQYHLPITSGSDVHNTIMLGGGIETKEPLETVADYVELIKKKGDYSLLG